MNRGVENGLAVAGALPLVLYGLGEAAHTVNLCFGECTTSEHSFPWAILLGALVLVLPKTVGRATTGRVWEILAKGAASRIAKQKIGTTGISNAMEGLPDGPEKDAVKKTIEGKK